jgi:hypothetical protein
MCSRISAWPPSRRWTARRTSGSTGDDAIEIGDDLAQLDAAIEALPNSPAVFLLWPKEGEPYLSKTNLLRRRLLRLLKERERPSRLLNLRHTVRRIEYCLTGSAFESALVLYEEARRHFPGTYLDLIKLRMPPYVKIVLSNQFPRSHITTHLTRSAGCISGRSARACRPSGSKANSSICSRCGAARRTWFLATAPRLHLWRDGHVPAAVPGGGGTGGIQATKWRAWWSSCAPTANRCSPRLRTRATA